MQELYSNQNKPQKGFNMKITTLLITLLFASFAFAGVQGYNSTTNLGLVSAVKCSTGLTCSKVGDKLNMIVSTSQTSALTLAGGINASSGQLTRFMGWRPPTLTSGTSTTPSATTLYLGQVYVPANATLTGIKVSNGATVGTDKYIVALFNSSGAAVANSALAGTTTAGADVYQAIPFTATYAVVGPAMYWVGLYVNGTTDRFRSVPAVGEHAGLAGSVTGQTFGTVAAVTLPTTFTADKAPVAFTY